MFFKKNDFFKWTQYYLIEISTGYIYKDGIRTNHSHRYENRKKMSHLISRELQAMFDLKHERVSFAAYASIEDLASVKK